MTRARRATSEVGLYHVFARGVGRCIIYEDDHDRELFLFYLERFLVKPGIKILAWCLMDNHYHLVLQGSMERISEGMKRLNSSYALAFNEEHDRNGHLFQGRFRSEAIDDEEYLLIVVRYVHQNPVRAGFCATCDYEWSSYRGYFSNPRLVDNGLMHELLGTEEAFRALHDEVDYTAACIDVDSPRGRRFLSAERALEVARAVLLDTRIEEVAGLDRARRNESLRALKEAGLSVRQIERITGVPKTVIANA